MIKLSSPKESICFNFENEDQRSFFDKAKKCDIIKNNNSVFLRKILSVKNQSLLNETLKQSKSQIFNHINTSKYEEKTFNVNNSSSNLTLNPNKIDNSFNQYLSPKICLEDINFNNTFKIDISPSKVQSPKIIVNKNKNLRLHTQKEKEKENINEQTPFSETIFSEKNNASIDSQKTLDQNIKGKYSLNTINTDFNINPEIKFSNLYTKNYIRKPVVIKFKKGFNCTNIKNETIKNDKLILSQEENKENIPNNNQQILKKVKTEEKIKPYNFYKKNTIETELFRCYEDLEKKSVEITKRKRKKNSINSTTNIKKENNLVELKESLENYRQRTKSNIKRKRKKKNNFINKNLKIEEFKTNNLILNSNTIAAGKIDEYNYHIKKCLIPNTSKNTHWHRQTSIQFNNINTSDINENKSMKNKKINFYQIPKVKSEELLVNNKNYENIKKKSIKINFIEENKTENIYNITLNTNNVNEAFNRFHISLNHNQDFNYKNYMIRKKYGKKTDKKDMSSNQLITKKYREDNKSNDNISELSHCLSQDFINPNSNDLHIKVNKKNKSGKKLIKINNSQQNINTYLDLEDKINNEINNHLHIINGIDMLNGFLSTYNRKILKEKFKSFCNYCNQIGFNNNTTILTNISHLSQLSELKYVKKIVQKDRNSKRKDSQNSKRLIKTKSFNAEKQKILILKRKEFGFFEKYENILDFINKFRLILINYSTKKNKAHI